LLQFHQRLFTLDVQVAFEREQGRRALGEWILRKFKAVRKRRGDALATLADLTHGEEELEHEWRKQVEVQTRPLTRATGGLANKSIKAILALMEVSSGLGKEITSVSRKLTRNPSMDTLEDLVETRRNLTEEKNQIDAQLESKHNALGVNQWHDLRTLINDKYLQARTKALAIKERLRAKVQGKKFEFERVDRAYSNTANGVLYPISQGIIN
jgi:L-fucose mutarotase/ribose pyranase (RbsD/FucU family)